MADTQTQNQGIKLPERLIGSVELSRVIRELKLLDDWMNQAAIRTPGQPMKIPKASQSLEDIAAMNNVSLLDPQQRVQLIELLQAFLVHAPRIHMSFAVEPTAKFTTEVIGWLRANVHPLVLLEIGLQPNLAAGCMVRTTNKYFDMSLRNRFKDNRHLLVEKIAAIVPAQPAPEPAPAVTPAQEVKA